MKERTKKYSHLPLILTGILLLATFLRFYNFSSWLFFGMDQEYEALIIKNIVSGKHFPLIGVNAGDTGLYLGPFFIYFATIPFVLFGGNPIGWALTASLLGVFVCYLVYRVGKEMFSARVGIFACLFYAGSFLASFYDRQFWNPMPVAFFSLITGFLLYLILVKKVNKLISLAIVFGLAIQCHLSMLIFIPLILYVLWVRRKVLSRKIILSSVFIFILLQTPLILFELRHNFINTKAGISLFTSWNLQSSSFSTLPERNALLLSTLGRFFWVPIGPDLFLESGQCRELSWFRRNAYPEGILLVLTGIAIFGWWHLYKQKRKPRKTEGSDFTSASKIIIGILLLTLVFVEFYNRNIFEYYLLFLFPWLAIVLGRTVDSVWERNHGKLITIPIIFLFIVLNSLTLVSTSYSYSYQDKVEAVKFAKKYLKEYDYSLEAAGECPRFGGYRYLFEYFAGTPLHSYMDSYFFWLYPKDIEDKSSSRIVLLSLIDPREKAESIARWEEVKFRYLTENKIITEEKFGKIKVFILAPK